MKTLFFSLLIIFITSCRTQSISNVGPEAIMSPNIDQHSKHDSKVDTTKNAPMPNPDNTSDDIHALTNTLKTDRTVGSLDSTLTLAPIKISYITSGANVFPSITLNPSHDVKFIEFKICKVDASHKTGLLGTAAMDANDTPGCESFENLAASAELTHLEMGNYDLAVRGCSQSVSSTNWVMKSCGDWYENAIHQGPSPDQVTKQKAEARSALSQTIYSYGEVIYQQILTIKQAKPECKTIDLNTTITDNTIEAFLAAGPQTIGLGLMHSPSFHMVISANGQLAQIIYDSTVFGKYTPPPPAAPQSFRNTPVGEIVYVGALGVSVLIASGVSYYVKQNIVPKLQGIGQKGVQKFEQLRTPVKVSLIGFAVAAVGAGLISLWYFGIFDNESFKKVGASLGLADASPTDPCAIAMNALKRIAQADTDVLNDKIKLQNL